MYVYVQPYGVFPVDAMNTLRTRIVVGFDTVSVQMYK